MNVDWIRKFCMAMPAATEQVMWGHDLVFKVAGKMFAVAALEPDKTIAAFKCTPEEFAEMIERDGIVPAPYAARHHWVALERFDALTRAEYERLLANSYRLVVDKLPRRAQAQLLSASSTSRKPEKPSAPRVRTAKRSR